MSDPVAPEPPNGGDEQLSIATIGLYSAPITVVLFAQSLVSFYFLKFATDILYVAPAAAGTLLLLGRLWDAINDPLIGRLSDRTRTRWGRRRPWFAASALPLGLSVAALWGPPKAVEGAALFPWLLVAMLLFLTFFSTFRVPHLAFGAELARGYHERTRLFGGSQLFEGIGLIAASVAIWFIEDGASPRDVAARIGVASGVLIFIVLTISTLFMRERPEFQALPQESTRHVFRGVVANPHARILLGVLFFDQMGFTTTIAALPYLTDYVIDERGRTAIYMGAAVISLIVGIPFWISISQRFGKRPVWIVSLAAKLVVLTLMFFAPASEFGGTWLLLGVVLIGGLAGPTTLIGPSLKADVVDWDEAQSGFRREGAYFATWNFFSKSAGALGVWFMGIALAATGFVADAAQTETAILGIRSMTTLFPLAMHFIAMLFLFRFALDEDTHRLAREAASLERSRHDRHDG